MLDANKQVVGAHRSQKRNLQHAYAPKFAIFHGKKRHKIAAFWCKIVFFGLSQAVEDLPTPILKVLDPKKYVVWGHRSPKHNLQHANYLSGFFFMLQVLRFLDVIKSYVLDHSHGPLRICHKPAEEIYWTWLVRGRTTGL